MREDKLNEREGRLLIVAKQLYSRSGVMPDASTLNWMFETGEYNNEELERGITLFQNFLESNPEYGKKAPALHA